MKTKIPLLLTLIGLSLTSTAQVPITVNRSTVTSGGNVILPVWVTNGKIFPQTFKGDGVFSPTASAANTTASSSHVTIANAIISATPTHVIDDNFTIDPATWPDVTATANITVKINADAPAVFTNTMNAVAFYINPLTGDSGNFAFPQTYIFTIVEDGGSSTPENATLFGHSTRILNVSRKSSESVQRKLLGFELKATIPATLKNIAFMLSNSSTNTFDHPTKIQLVQDADGGREWDAGDTVLATATNANGLAVFQGLNVLLTSTNKTFFLTASIQPSKQSRASFISASLSPQNILILKEGTTSGIEILGSAISGDTFAFLDTTDEEDKLESDRLDSRIQSGIGSLHLKQDTQSTSPSNSKSRINSILPAAAAGAAAIGAAFTSDSLSQGSLSHEFTPSNKEKP